MALTMTATAEDNTQRRTKLYGTATVTGTYATGGETVTWTTLTGTSGAKALINSLTPTAPAWVEFIQANPAGSPLWYQAVYNFATSKLQFVVTGTGAAGSAELAAGAYPAGLTGATFRWTADFVSE